MPTTDFHSDEVAIKKVAARGRIQCASGIHCLKNRASSFPSLFRPVSGAILFRSSVHPFIRSSVHPAAASLVFREFFRAFSNPSESTFMKSFPSNQHEHFHHVWIGALVRPTAEPDGTGHDTFPTPPGTDRLASARMERLTDVVLAVTYVAACALMAWAGAAWL